jgi:hypothetical protein
VIARGFFLLVAAFLFFVDDEQAEIFHGGEDGGAGANDDAGFAIAHAPPFAGAFDVAESGMEDGDAFEACAEPGATEAADPEGESDFRDKDDGGFSAGESFLDGAEIDFGFSAAGDAEEEADAEFGGVETGADGGDGGGLAWIEVVRGRSEAGVEGVFAGVDGFVPGFEEILLEEAVDDGAGDAGGAEEDGERERAAFDFEDLADAFFLFGEVGEGFGGAGLPGDDAVQAAFAADDGFLQLEEIAAEEAGGGGFFFFGLGERGEAGAFFGAVEFFEEVEFFGGEAGFEAFGECGVAGGSEAQLLAGAEFGERRKHGAEDFAGRGEIVGGHPLAEGHEGSGKSGKEIEGLGDGADFGGGGRLGVESDDDADERAAAKGDEDAGAGAEGFGHFRRDGVGEERGERDRESHVAVEFAHCAK